MKSVPGRAECAGATPPLCLPLPPSLGGRAGAPGHPGGDWGAGTFGDGCRVSMARRSLSSSALSLASSLSSKTWGRIYGERPGQRGSAEGWRARWGSTGRRSDVRNPGAAGRSKAHCAWVKGRLGAQGQAGSLPVGLPRAVSQGVRMAHPQLLAGPSHLTWLTHPYTHDSTLVLPVGAFSPFASLFKNL